MRRFVVLIGVIIVLFGINGCGIFRSKTALLNSDSKAEAKAINEAETTIIDALNHKDRELLKSVFSEDAIAKDPAMEEGIDYLFDLYQGDFLEVTYRNHSSSDHWGEPGRTKEIGARCDIKTSKTTYRLHYFLWAIQEQEPEKKGFIVFNFLSMRKEFQGLIQ